MCTVLFTKQEKGKMILSSGANCAATPKLLDVLVVGGGLSGVMVAHELQHGVHPMTWNLLEANTELGGRLMNDSKGHQIDMGGAWVWPSHQPYMKKLISKLSIPTFTQPDDPSSTRIEGGAIRFVDTLAESLPKDQIKKGSAVVSCALDSIPSEKGPVVRVDTRDKESYFARKVVFAVPPKILSTKVKFDPPLSLEKQAAMARSQTWMAGVTKVSLLYDKRFWDKGSSNSGLPSNAGPAFQVYDASTKDASVVALTFFAMVPPNSEASKDDAVLAEQCAAQMQKLWGYFRLPRQAEQAKDYTDFHVQRWPKEEFISDDPNPVSVNPHPHPVRALSASEWNGALLFAGTETDRGSPGVMEGAIGAALRVVQELRDSVKKMAGIGSESSPSS